MRGELKLAADYLQYLIIKQFKDRGMLSIMNYWTGGKREQIVKEIAFIIDSIKCRILNLLLLYSDAGTDSVHL